jgi:hypothetical protein
VDGRWDRHRRGLQNLGAQPFGETEHVDSAMDAGLRGLVHRRSRTGEIVDLVDFHVERESHVVTHQFEALVADDMRDVTLGAGEEIVDADEIGAALQQALAQMRAEKTGPAGHENAFFKMHARSVHITGLRLA